MAELKTKATTQSVSEFLNGIGDKRKIADCRAVAKIMREATGKRAKLWGTGIVGFGSYDYKYASGHSGTWPIVCFSPRSQNLTIYIMPGCSNFDKLMKCLGKYKTGKSCLYIKSLEDVDQKVLKALIEGSVKLMKRKYSVK